MQQATGIFFSLFTSKWEKIIKENLSLNLAKASQDSDIPIKINEGN